MHLGWCDRLKGATALGTRQTQHLARAPPYRLAIFINTWPETWARLRCKSLQIQARNIPPCKGGQEVVSIAE